MIEITVELSNKNGKWLTGKRYHEMRYEQNAKSKKNEACAYGIAFNKNNPLGYSATLHSGYPVLF